MNAVRKWRRSPATLTPIAVVDAASARVNDPSFSWGSNVNRALGFAGTIPREPLTNPCIANLPCDWQGEAWSDMNVSAGSMTAYAPIEDNELACLTSIPGTAERAVLLYSVPFTAFDAQTRNANTATWVVGTSYPSVNTHHNVVLDAMPLLDPPPTPLRVRRLARIQAAFDFPLSVLAEVLQRSRTQLYKWLDPGENVELQGESHDRLAELASLAEHWLTRTSSPLYPVAREHLPSGRTMLSLLTESEWDIQAILAAFDHLAPLADARVITPSQRLAEAGFERRRRELPDDDD